MCLPHKEAFFGGAAGGGKSDALLMAALQYVDYPGYAALVLRKTLTDLKQPGALLSRMQEWLDPWEGNGVRYVASEHTYYFETADRNRPAKIQFGYIGEQNAKIRYQGIEVQGCFFDELTQHTKEDYTYLFSRLRKNACKTHKTYDSGPLIGKPRFVQGCPECELQKSLPIRMRSASNPGGFGHRWVKERFAIGPHIDPVLAKKQGIKVRYIGHNKERPFIPSFVADNPYLDQAAYYESLDELSELERRQLKDGDWDASVDSRFRPEWMRYYSVLGNHFILGEDFRGPAHVRQNLLRIFTTVDPASSSKEGPGDTQVWTNIEESYTVISTWALTRDFNLLWLDMVRFRQEIPDITEELRACYRKWRPDYFIIEANGLGAGVFQYAQRAGLPVRRGWRHTDKVVNATDAILRMSQGKIWMPQASPWRKEAEEELFSWFGHPKQMDDIIDTLADAAKDVSWEAAHEEAHEEHPDISGDDLPDAVSQPFDSLGFNTHGHGSSFL